MNNPDNMKTVWELEDELSHLSDYLEDLESTLITDGGLELLFTSENCTHIKKNLKKLSKSIENLRVDIMPTVEDYIKTDEDDWGCWGA